MTSRITPRLDPDNRFFWTSGAEGVLRVLRCNVCLTHIHPPRPFCPACLSEDVAPDDLPGTATVHSYTVNHQKWRPDLEVPFIIARVAPDGAKGVILTTNITGCEPGEIDIGDRVIVEFQQQDDIWFPLFRKVS